jgi:isochorismate synthase
MPRWLYRVDAGRAWLRLTWDASAMKNESRLAEQAQAISEFFEKSEEPGAVLSVAPLNVVEHLDPEAWNKQVEAIREVIDQGDFHKIVAARRSTVTCDVPLRPQDVLTRLAERHIDCRRFAFAFHPETCFVGATPERLVRLKGGEVHSEALAGSIPVSDAEGLLDSAKDALEHRLVVDDVVAALRPYCDTVEYDETPSLRRLRDVAHMETPIRGVLRQDAHILDLVEALHPTSAVGGVPQRGAQDWIVAHEPARGWYSGPVGWFDVEGEGDFAVALRCGLLTGKRAYLFAGAGVVGASEPALEYEETRWKMLTLMRALGVQEQA